MKRAYQKPCIRKVDYNFQEQVTAASYPISDYAAPLRPDRCTWGDGECNVIFNVPLARGINNCSHQGS